MSGLEGKAVVLGLDGVTWDLLDRLCEEGVMPNLARAREGARWGSLASCLPPYSAPAWTSIATGKNPGRHGIFDFWESTGDGERRPVSSLSARGARLWDIASAAGRRVHVWNVPVSYPPAKVNGTFVSGMMTPGESVAYSHPAELKAELKALPGGYEADPYAAGLTGRAFIRQTHRWIRQKERALQHVISRGDWDLLFTVIQAPDPLQHKFWNLLDPTDPRHDPKLAAELLPDLHEAYRRCDEVIGDRLAMAEQGAFVLILSDHGFGRYEKLLYVNRLLEDAGLLVRARTARPGSGRVSARSLIKAARRVDVLGLESRLPNRVKDRLASGLDRALATPVDRERTLAYAGSGSGECVFVSSTVPAEQRDDVCRRVIEALMAVRDPDTGEPVLDAAMRREQVYEGTELERLPDVLLDFGERPYLAADRLAAPELIERLPAAGGGGRHRRHGVILAAGPGVPAGRVEDASIVDVCPTVLHAMGLAVPDDVDGRVLTDMFSDGRAVQSAAATDQAAGQTEYSSDEEAAIRASLEGIGYM
ncbi:MAG: alkaline phosphatase family protein [Gaiellales bacterium]